jgi:hypothetical protein
MTRRGATAANGAGQAPFILFCDGPLRFIGRRDHTEPMIYVNLPIFISDTSRLFFPLLTNSIDRCINNNTVTFR